MWSINQEQAETCFSLFLVFLQMLSATNQHAFNQTNSPKFCFDLTFHLINTYSKP